MTDLFIYVIHKKFLLSFVWNRFEQGLQTHCPSCMLPFWDNRCERRLKGNVKYSILFSGDLLGNAVGYDTTGFAKGWTTVNKDSLNMYPTLNRNIGVNIAQLFPENAEEFVKVNQFQDMCGPWNYTFESMHGGPHMFIGGLMSYIACSPNDPIFFMHHCFIDNFLQRFKNYSLANNFSLEYPDISQANLPPGFNATQLNFYNHPRSESCDVSFRRPGQRIRISERHIYDTLLLVRQIPWIHQLHRRQWLLQLDVILVWWWSIA